jgi:alpha-1,3-glucan synthase
MSAWIFRAGLFEGLRQFWSMALWYWSNNFAIAESTLNEKLFVSTLRSAISFFLAGILLIFALLLFFGLPACYRQLPPLIPKFYSSFRKRGLAIWFIIAQFLQAYWLSGPYGRNWTFLWSQPIPSYQIFLLFVVFILVWASLMRGFWQYSQIHSWILPIFAVGLLSPRWAQMSWSTSNIGYSLVWPNGIGPYFSLSLWLWLGVLDAIQAVGLSMMLLQTLTRVHVAATLMAAQLVGAIAFILARATAPDNHGPGDVFPNPSVSYQGQEFWLKPLFWIGLMFQLLIAVGYLCWFRREQLSKP